jgi:DNA-binding response OmpR family regulator
MADANIYFEPDPAPLAARPNGFRVLVVDDERDALRTLLALLRFEGHEVRAVTNGSHVLAAVRDFNPHVVVLDIHLPGVSGWQLARDIKADTKPQSPLLIGLSGKYTQTADKLLSDLAGFDYYLLKPCDPKVLFALVEKATKREAPRVNVLDFPAKGKH